MADSSFSHDTPSWLFYNERPATAAQTFIADIKDHLDAGYGFVPFIGAGLSAPSGAPLIWDLRLYLERCIGLALGVDDPEARPWNPRTDRWPSFIDRGSTGNDDWLSRVREAFEHRREADPWDIEVPVFQEAFGAMAEWRTALSFLSRLERDCRKTEFHPHGVITLSAPDQEVIDACIREVLKDKQPTLGHSMLAVLGGVLRVDVILSTNFDDLLERAFGGARNPLSVFEVHLSSVLPHWSALSQHCSLIKLHGHRHSLRADYTLDALPTETDQRRFLEYLVSAKGRQGIFSERNHTKLLRALPAQNHLLIMGVSATERRTRSFIETAWTSLTNDFTVWWLCHTAKDVAAVQTFTDDYKRSNRDVTDGNWVGSRILKQENLGLFLLELYQSIRHGLPTTGTIFPLACRLSIPPLPSIQDIAKDSDTEKTRLSGFVELLRKQLLSVNTLGYEGHKLLLATSAPPIRGVTSACASFYNSLQSEGTICIWLEMNEIASTDDLFDQLLEAAYYRIGIESWKPAFVSRRPGPRGAEIQRLVSSTNKQWVIFLNARETPGADFGEDSDVLDPDKPNGWLDNSYASVVEKYTVEDSRCAESFTHLVAELCGANSRNLSIVLMYRSFSSGCHPPLLQYLETKKMASHVNWLQNNCVAFNENEAIKQSLLWTLNGPNDSSDDAASPAVRRYFLHALVLMQRTRFLASLWSDAVSSPTHTAIQPPVTHTDVPISSTVALETCGLLRRKPGNFIWMHARARNQLRHLLCSASARTAFASGLKNDASFSKVFSGWKPEEMEPKIHNDLAQWYLRVFTATSSPAALFESLYHMCKGARALLARGWKGSVSEAAENLDAATSLLNAHSWLLQTQGYPRSNYSRLEYIRDGLCNEIEAESDRRQVSDGKRGKVTRMVQSVASSSILRRATYRLRMQAVEVTRAIAREMSDDSRAAAAQNAIGRLLCHEPDGADDGFDLKRLAQFLCAQTVPTSRGETAANPIEWIRWCRWGGMLKTNARSYDDALFDLTLAVASCQKHEASFRFIDKHAPHLTPSFFKTLDEVISRCRDGKITICGRNVTDLLTLRLELLRVVEQIAFQLLLVLNVQRRNVLRSRQARSTSRTMIGVRAVIRSGLDLAEQLLAIERSFDSHHTIPAMWFKSRLLMHASVCEMWSEHWHVGMELLADAESCLNADDPRRMGTDRAIIELHRAELRMLEAEGVELLAYSNGETARPLSFAAVCHEVSMRTDLKNEYGDILWYESGVAIRQKYFAFSGHAPSGNSSTSPNRNIRKVKALIQDAMRFFWRAEQILTTRRRNVWWMTWFFQRKLKAIAMTLWTTVTDMGTPIPFLGPEAAPKGTTTIADDLLEDSLRMIQTDSYRLATVLEAYVSCACALHVRMMMDDQARQMRGRQYEMRERIHKALSRLQAVEEERYRIHGTHAQSNIRRYIMNVLRQATATIDFMILRSH